MAESLPSSRQVTQPSRDFHAQRKKPSPPFTDLEHHQQSSSTTPLLPTPVPAQPVQTSAPPAPCTVLSLSPSPTLLPAGGIHHSGPLYISSSRTALQEAPQGSLAAPRLPDRTQVRPSMQPQVKTINSPLSSAGEVRSDIL